MITWKNAAAVGDIKSEMAVMLDLQFNTSNSR